MHMLSPLPTFCTHETMLFHALPLSILCSVGCSSVASQTLAISIKIMPYQNQTLHNLLPRGCRNKLRKHYSHLVEGLFLGGKAAWSLSGLTTESADYCMLVNEWVRLRSQVCLASLDQLAKVKKCTIQKQVVFE